jgi:hypothetical protein
MFVEQVCSYTQGLEFFLRLLKFALFLRQQLDNSCHFSPSRLRIDGTPWKNAEAERPRPGHDSKIQNTVLPGIWRTRAEQ